MAKTELREVLVTIPMYAYVNMKMKVEVEVDEAGAILDQEEADEQALSQAHETFKGVRVVRGDHGSEFFFGSYQKDQALELTSELMEPGSTLNADQRTMVEYRKKA